MMKSPVQKHIDEHFIENEFGIWCPNCQAAIDYFWPESCDHCGWPAEDHERYDLDDGNGRDFEAWLDDRP